MLFDSVNYLYQKGARSFVIFNVPPVDRSPYARLPREEGEWQGFSAYAAKCIAVWNTCLESEAKVFTREHPDASLFVVSTHALFTALLDDPDERKDDGEGKTEEIWQEQDDITLTDRAQRDMADAIALAFKRVEG